MLNSLLGDFSMEEVRYTAYVLGSKGQFPQAIEAEKQQGSVSGIVLLCSSLMCMCAFFSDANERGEE